MLANRSGDKTPVYRGKTSESSLLSLARSQKLDLLIHLTSNLKQSLVVCGASGIGKTTLLTELKLRSYTVWPVLDIRASTKLSLESFQQQLAQFITQHYGVFANQELLSILSQLETNNEKIIVIIDNAGFLVPGLINKLIQYATAHECLRVIFSMTHDELNTRRSSDNWIDNCHFIDIPPLTENQCGFFLQNLSVQPDAVITYNAINDRLITKVYKETHGIPGKIISSLPEYFISSHSRFKNKVWVLGIVPLFAIVIFGIGFILINEENYSGEIKKTDKTDKFQGIDLIETTNSPLVYSAFEEINREELEPQVELPVRVENPLKDDAPSIIKNADGQSEEIIYIVNDGNIHLPLEEKNGLQKPVIENNGLDGVVSEQVLKLAKHPHSNESKTIFLDDNTEWVLDQLKDKYTIQLMVLSKKQSVIRFLKNNINLKKELKYFQVNRDEQIQYVLIYGSFKNGVLASEEMKSLPVKYRKSWVRKFRQLQTKINNTALI